MYSMYFLQVCVLRSFFVYVKIDLILLLEDVNSFK